MCSSPRVSHLANTGVCKQQHSTTSNEQCNIPRHTLRKTSYISLVCPCFEYGAVLRDHHPAKGIKALDTEQSQPLRIWHWSQRTHRYLPTTTRPRVADSREKATGHQADVYVQDPSQKHSGTSWTHRDAMQ